MHAMRQATMTIRRVQMWWDENKQAIGEVAYFWLMFAMVLDVWVYTMRLP